MTKSATIGAVASALLSFSALGALAVEAESPSYSTESLVMMLSSESACHLSFDKAAIERFIQHYTDQSRTIPNLGGLVGFERDYVVAKMTPSTLIAHCAQVQATAKLYQFSK